MNDELDNSIARLKLGAQDLETTDLSEKLGLLRQVLENLFAHSDEWVRASCKAKGISFESNLSAEEILAGPGALARYLLLLMQSLESLRQSGVPTLPGTIKALANGQKSVPIVPARGLFDSTLFRGISAEVILESEISEGSHFDTRACDPSGQVAVTLVLGAGNVSSISATDTLTKVFQQNSVVLLKMSPVNDYLTEIFEAVFQPIIRRGWLQLTKGDAALGAEAVHHPAITQIHVTGSQDTHDRIVWGNSEDGRARRKEANDPILQKNITSELGNVSPWIIVPGRYSERQLRSQAENITASIVNNAGFNCLTTRMLITSSKWDQRDRFLGLIKAALKAIPRRKAYYPGAFERYERFSGNAAEPDQDGTLPWTLMTGVNPEESPHLFQEEAFVGLCAEHALDEADAERFTEAAVEFANESLYGTLCSAITVPAAFQKENRAFLEKAAGKMNYGSVCFNQWPGLVYGLMAPPWGAAPGSESRDVQSGRGSVHNTYFLTGIEKTILRGPLATFPKPVWFASNRMAKAIGEDLMDLYKSPSIWKLPKLISHSIRG